MNRRDDQTPRPCESWCTRHDAFGEICFADDVLLDFGGQEARTDLSFCAEDGVSVGLSLNGRDGVELDPEQAQAVAYAILVQVAQSRGDKGLVEEFRAMAERHAHAVAGAR